MPASPPPTHPDLDREQAYLDRRLRLPGRHARPDAPGGRRRRLGRRSEVDSAIAQAHLRHRLRSLDPDVPGLGFGRLDDEDGDTWYVGRRHVEDDARRPRRRRLAGAGVDALLPGHRRRPAGPAPAPPVPDDRHASSTTCSTRSSTTPTASTPPHHGGIPDPLLAELERSRTGAMRDIVATIAGRAGRGHPGRRSTPAWSCRAGRAPGKTAVGLHRAAFLLYEHRRAARPRAACSSSARTRVFLRYIAQVLPSLGEAATRQTTIERLVAGVGRLRVRAVDTPARARLLGDARMAAGAGGRRPRPALRPPADRRWCVEPSDWGRVTARLPPPTWRRRSTRSLARGVPVRDRPGRLPDPAGPAGPPAPRGRRGERGAVPADAFEAAWQHRLRGHALAGNVADDQRPRRWSSGCSPAGRRWAAPAAGLLGARRAAAAAAPGRPAARRRAVDPGRAGAGRRGRGAASTACPAPTATSWWTRRRTSRPWSCGRSPGAARPGR